MPRKKKTEMAKEIVLKENATVKLENRLVNARYTLSLREMKMVMAFAAHICKSKDEFELCSVSAKELGEYMELSDENPYAVIKATAKKLIGKSLWLEWYEDGYEEASWWGVPWFRCISYSAKTSQVTFRFADEIKPLLLQVQKTYVRLECKPLMAFKCMYSNRFLLWFAEWEKLSPYTIGIDEIRARLKLEKKHTKFSDFKKYVIEPAIAEINALTDFSVKAEPNKRGRSYVSYTFTIKRKAAKADTIEVDAIPTEWTDEQNAVYSELCGYGITQHNAKSIMSKTTLDTIRNNIEYAKAQQQAGSVKSLARYLYTAITEDYAGAVKLAAEQEQRAAAQKMADKLRTMSDTELVEYFLRQQQAAELASQQRADEFTDEQREHSRQTGLAGIANLKAKRQKS